MMPLLIALAATAALLVLIVAAIGWPPTRRAATALTRHTGATERWSPLATIGAQPLSGHALDPAPSLTATHAELAAIGDALIGFSRNVEAALHEFVQPLDAETLGRLLRAREWADHPDTAELDRAALEALLAEDPDAATVAARR